MSGFGGWLLVGIALGILIDGLIFDMPWSRRWKR